MSVGFSPGRTRPMDAEELGFVTLARMTAAPRLERLGWACKREGADGLGCWDHHRRGLRFIHSVCREEDGQVWVHFSLSRRDDRMPSWEETRDVFHEVCGDDALGLVVVPPVREHVNRSEVAHVWYCLTARPTPDFTRGTGSI